MNTALNDTNPATAFNPFGGETNNNPATLASIAGDYHSHIHLDTQNCRIQRYGPVFALPGGNLELSIGAEYRLQDFSISNSPSACGC